MDNICLEFFVWPAVFLVCHFIGIAFEQAATHKFGKLFKQIFRVYKVWICQITDSKKKMYFSFFSTSVKCNSIRFGIIKTAHKTYKRQKPQKSVMVIKNRAKTIVITCEMFQRHKISVYWNGCCYYYYLLQFSIFMGSTQDIHIA